MSVSARKTGRPRTLGDDFRRHLRELSRCGMSDKAIAASLNRSGIPTPHGGREWWPTTVRVARTLPLEDKRDDAQLGDDELEA